MRSFRTSFVVAAAVVALSWSGISRADNDVNSKKGTTTKSQTTQMPPETPATPSTTDATVTAPPPPAEPTYVAPPQTTYSTTTTTSADYDNSAAADRVTYSSRPNRPMLATGAAIFLGTYAASAIVGAASPLPADDNLFIPVAGPWIDLAERPCGFLDCTTSEDINQFLLIGSGVAQGTGVALALASLFVSEEHATTKTASSRDVREKSIAASKPTVKVLPTSMRSGGGIGAVGTF